MRLAIIGYGKMGKIIEEIALNRGHEVVLKISSQNTDEFNSDNLKHVDIAIEFTNPHVAYINVMDLLEAGVPTVCGSTGWHDKMEDAKQKCIQKGTSFIWASNFSIGVNLFWEINKKMAKIMVPNLNYIPQVEETHHVHKKDAPSGTAITTAEQILNINPGYNSWKLGSETEMHELSILAHRIDEVPGTHIVKYSSEIDEISLSHIAHSRKGFALGAVLAAEFIVDKKGVFQMCDVLGLQC